MLRIEISEEMKKKIVKLKKEGLTNAVISQRTGISKDRILKVMREVANEPKS